MITRWSEETFYRDISYWQVFQIRKSLNVDPDPGFYLNADPDSGFWIPDPDPDPRSFLPKK